jgi:hypothetical protein
MSEKVSAVTPITREGLFQYFDQMADEDGRIVTTSRWLADVGMLIVHEVRRENNQPRTTAKRSKTS